MASKLLRSLRFRSIAKNVLAPNCSRIGILDVHVYIGLNETETIQERSLILDEDYTKGWPPFNITHCKALIGGVDYSWLFAYAVFLIISGLIADRVNLRYFLTIGMIGSGLFVGLLGVAYYGRVHHLAYFIVIQIFVGIFQSTGWPGVVAIMGNWFGKRYRGLILGIWNSHTSIGNILGTAVPSIWAQIGQPWAWSFLVPGLVMIGMGIVIFLFLIVDPTDVGLPPPIHHDAEVSCSSPLVPKGKSYHSNEKNDMEMNTITQQNSLNQSVIESEGSMSQDEDAKLIKTESDDNTSSANKLKNSAISSAVSLLRALKIPGVIEYSLSLFFAKLVAYTFLFWLPYYVAFHPIGGVYIGEQQADLLSTLYDVGGIIGGIFTGGLSDLINARAISCVIMMYLAIPTLFLYRYVGHNSLGSAISLILLCGLFINGPYALITTAVSNDLGTHKSLKENQRAKATVGAIIDGMGSLGAAFGPLVTGTVSDFLGWNSAFYVLMASCFISSLMLSRLLVKEVIGFYRKFKRSRRS